MRKVCSLLLALMLVMSLAVPAAAAENEGFLTFFEDQKQIKFSCSPGISNAYDLFDEDFKSVMPGDKIVGYVTIQGNFLSFSEDTLKVWMRAIPHNEQTNLPKTSGTGSIAYMEEFLRQLTLRVYNENQSKTTPIFEGQADELDGLKEKVYLGSFRKNGKIVLRVELDVPITLDNRFANRVGEVDWEFTVEAYDDPSYSPTDNPKTGDYIMMAVAIMAVSGVALAVLLIRKKRKK